MKNYADFCCLYVLWFWFQFRFLALHGRATIVHEWKHAAPIHLSHLNGNEIAMSLLIRCFINFESGKCYFRWMITRYRVACVLKRCMHAVIVNDLCFINYFECHANISIFSLSTIQFNLIVHISSQRNTLRCFQLLLPWFGIL